MGELTQEEIQRIHRFARELTDTLKSSAHGGTGLPDERFPDSLLIAYDGEDRQELVQRWDVHGCYRTGDEDGAIDDSDCGAVPDYPFKGEGLGAFSTQLVKKERFVRTFVNLHHDVLFHRQLRLYEDQRDEYKQLYDFAFANDRGEVHNSTGTQGFLEEDLASKACQCRRDRIQS